MSACVKHGVWLIYVFVCELTRTRAHAAGRTECFCNFEVALYLIYLALVCVPASCMRAGVYECHFTRVTHGFTQVVRTEFARVPLEKVLDIRAFELARVLQRDATFMDPLRPERTHDPLVSSLTLLATGPVRLPLLKKYVIHYFLLLFLLLLLILIINSSSTPFHVTHSLHASQMLMAHTGGLRRRCNRTTSCASRACSLSRVTTRGECFSLIILYILFVYLLLLFVKMCFVSFFIFFIFFIFWFFHIFSRMHVLSCSSSFCTGTRCKGCIKRSRWRRTSCGTRPRSSASAASCS